MGEILENNTTLCPHHDTEFCKLTGTVKRWVVYHSDWWSEKAQKISGVLKQNPSDLVPIMGKDGYIWVGTNAFDS